MAEKIRSGVVHKVPTDLRTSIVASERVRAAWNSLTPLARNEWICWTLSVKKPETRRQHVARVGEDLVKGKKRPCCFAGCPHRNRGK